MANRFEERVQRFLREQGFEVLPNGWPDFLCIRKSLDGQTSLLFVEAKSENDRIRKNQERVLNALAEAGLKVYLVRESDHHSEDEGGFLTIDWRERLGLI